MAKLSLKDAIIALREEGRSYREISEMTGCSPEYARTIWARSSRIVMPGSHADGMCKYCGKKLEETKITKPRQFCNDKCCDAYFNAKKARKPYILICEYCQREFVSYGVPKRRFCSRECQSLAMKEKDHEKQAV